MEIPKNYGVKSLDSVGVAVTGLCFVAIPIWWIGWTILALLHHHWWSAGFAQIVPSVANRVNTIARAYFLRDMIYWRSVQRQQSEEEERERAAAQAKNFWTQENTAQTNTSSTGTEKRSQICICNEDREGTSECPVHGGFSDFFDAFFAHHEREQSSEG
jgi:hypothetical protein